MSPKLKKILSLLLAAAAALTMAVVPAGAENGMEVKGGRFKGMPWQYDPSNGRHGSRCVAGEVIHHADRQFLGYLLGSDDQ